MEKPLNFQSIILTLQHFWAEQGCLLWQPYYTQVGAGTYNPATFLRVLGPEPWHVAYVEPSIRPDDARYGENPNRMQMHYQFQVILKPDPGNPQEIYLKSLEALGIDPHQHDIRFVEDLWESPALAAWGLGWEVWLDGQEITQYTYFQQAGGQPLDPVSVELTYGLERIAIALQRVNSFREIQWSPTLTDGDVNLQAEQEHSAYYFEVADVQRLRQMYDLFEAEAQDCLQNKLVLPAMDYLLKCSHTFNVLDTRGVIGVTERQGYFGRMRELSRRVAEAYLEQRQSLEYPWLVDKTTAEDAVWEGKTRTTDLPESAGALPPPQQPADFLLEIGTEELPVGDLADALEHLAVKFPELLREQRLEHSGVKVLGTPRRLVVHVTDLAPRQSELQQIIKGPPASRAFDEAGLPTSAAVGFARSKGLAVKDLQVQEMDGGRYVVAVIQQAGSPTLDVLSSMLTGLVASLRFEKPIRWNAANVTFSRPVRWLAALYGESVVPFEFAGLSSGRETRGLRFKEPERTSPRNAAQYFEFLSAQGIILDAAERRQTIAAQVERLASQVKGKVPDDPSLLAEVTNLVEQPTALRGTFDGTYLELPREVLISVMKKHQRYFPVEADGHLLPYFITVRNGGEEGIETVTEGNEHVIQARFADAAYFIRQDLKEPLEAFVPRLARLTFQVQLGSMLDKTRRICALVEELLPVFNLSEQEIQNTRRTAELCKADLTTQMVIEMTSLQGIMGRYYALHSKEPESVAQAIFEHYLPRFAGDHTPQSWPGLIVGLADRLDTLVGLFTVGLAPTGNKDPFALRRAALGLVQALLARELDFDLRPALQAAASHLPVEGSPQSLSAVQDFVVERLRNILLDQGMRYDVVDAVLAAQGYNPARAAQAVRQLSTWVARPDWAAILPTYSRCVRITREFKERYPVDPQLFAEPAEPALYRELLAAEAFVRNPGSVDDFLSAFLPLMAPINRFFDEVLVMVEEPALRQNRLGLLQRIAALAEGAADLSRLEGF